MSYFLNKQKFTFIMNVQDFGIICFLKTLQGASALNMTMFSLFQFSILFYN